jgi:broad specificity phosphatase PhoE
MNEINPFDDKIRNSYCELYIVRHGQTEWNVSKKVAGHIDIPLTDKGRSQAKELAKKLSTINFDAVFSSDLIRAKHTAEIIALERNLAVVTSRSLREKNYGEFEGKTQEELKKIFDLYNSLTKEEVYHYRLAKGAETDEEVIGRFITFLREVAVAYKGKTVLVASHHAVMRALLIHLGKGEYKNFPPNSIRNAAYIKLISDGTDFFVQQMDNIDIHNL